MSIDFHNKEIRDSYTSRNAHNSWIEVISKLVPIKDISKALDIGCGGGIYCKALSEMGVDSVTGVDFSDPILEGAREHCKEYKNVFFNKGNAYETGLDNNSFDLLLERALIHHIEDLLACFKEAYRLLEDNGFYIVQDRSPEDCLLKGNNSNIRGYFFELFPKLVDKETKRRHNSQSVFEKLKEVGFKEITEIKLWETRKVYENKEQLLKDLKERTGRSILHDLDNNELELLINHIDQSISITEDIAEKDRWTIWRAIK